jgi:hypothetical protein
MRQGGGYGVGVWGVGKIGVVGIGRVCSLVSLDWVDPVKL